MCNWRASVPRAEGLGASAILMNKSDAAVDPSDTDKHSVAGGAIQRAIDAVGAAGGGTVRLAAGAYMLADSVRLRPGVALVGDGPDTVLRRGPLHWSVLVEDADKGEMEFVPDDTTPWRPGMGVCMRDPVTGWAYGNDPVRIEAIRDGRCRVAQPLWANIATERVGIVVHHFPMVLIKEARGASVSDLAIDAAVGDPQGMLAGLRCDAVRAWYSPNLRLSRLSVRHAHSDGICFAHASVNALVEDCEVSHCRRHGIHPGSHSTDCVISGCRIHDCGSDGLYICWGIRRGRFIDNTISRNGHTEYRSGICIGHKDTDCVIAGNRIMGNCKHGIAFRRKTATNGAHRATVRSNMIADNGSPPEALMAVKAGLPTYERIGCGIHVEGITRDLVIENNIIRESRTGVARHQHHAIVLEAGVSIASLKDNRMEGHPGEALLDRRDV